jgi:hypothetical protein
VYGPSSSAERPTIGITAAQIKTLKGAATVLTYIDNRPLERREFLKPALSSSSTHTVHTDDILVLLMQASNAITTSFCDAAEMQCTQHLTALQSFLSATLL